MLPQNISPTYDPSLHTHYFGDPSYALSEAAYNQLKDSFFRLPNGGLFLYKGEPVFMACTADGDGIYETSTDCVLSVDSGTLAVLPVSSLDDTPKGAIYLTLSPAEEDLTQIYAWNGYFFVSHALQVHTSSDTLSCENCSQPLDSLRHRDLDDHICSDCQSIFDSND